ncbi:MAG TPA: LTA synthase family protein [Methylomirabilota bacterium]|nr:LTA synthase family protein [Methylomirabilota bacterium]
MTVLLIAWVLTLFVGWSLERFYALPRRAGRRPPIGYVLSAMLVSTVFLFWFSVSWRPVFTLVATLITLAIIVRISNFKYQELFEPLSFADFLLVPQIVRHPHLYQADFLWTWGFAAVVAAGLAVIGVWFIFEPTVLWGVGLLSPVVEIAAGLAALVALCLSIGALGRLPWIGPMLANHLPHADIRSDTARFGLFAAFAGHVARWFATPPGTGSPGFGEDHPHWPAVPAEDKRRPLVIAIQSESFFDLAGAGYSGPPLPHLEAARDRSEAHGRLVVPTAGAWTMRTEYSFLTGRPLRSYLFDAMDPYLRAAHRAPETLATRLHQAGYETHFIHPFDIYFFNRHRIYPGLGFQSIFSQDDFDTSDIYGFFISDDAVATRVLDLVEKAERDLFAFCVTMENHNPWERDRIPGMTQAADQYRHHLKNADAMLGRIVQALDAGDRDAIVCFYGDHVPILHRIAHPFPDTRTNYVVLRCGPWAKTRPAKPTPEREAGVEDLAGIILGLM